VRPRRQTGRGNLQLVPTSPLVPDDFAVPAGLRTEVDRVGFTYTVLDPDSGDVIGCVYLYPSKHDGHDVDVRSWVRADRAELDKPLQELVTGWLARDWPFTDPDYARR
jgi:hypothetical protein